VETNAREERLTFSTDLAGAVDRAEAVFIAVGTPTRGDDGQADLCFVYAAAKEIAAAMRPSVHGERIYIPDRVAAFAAAHSTSPVIAYAIFEVTAEAVEEERVWARPHPRRRANGPESRLAACRP
jgi:UDP-glucose/GDP-mannose dehydrogenase family, NAD binding domain